MTTSKSSIVLNRLSIVFLLVLLGLLFFAHTNPFAAVFLFMIMKGGLLFVALWFVLFIVAIVSLVRNRKNGYLKAGFPLIISILSVIAILIFANLESAQYLTDKDIVIHNKVLSPDGSHEIIEYVYDIGALGYTTTFTALVPLKNESRNLLRFKLPNEYKHARWLSNNSVEVDVDIRGYQAQKRNFKQDVSHIGDVNVIVHTKGFDTSSPRVIEHRSLSPDGSKELIAYRYQKGSDVGQLHISVIKKGEPIPRLGNVYIGSDYDDYVYFGEWRTSEKIALYTKFRYMANQFLLKDSGVAVDLVETKTDLANPNANPKQCFRKPL